MEKRGTATVVKNAGSFYLLSELPSWELFPAVLKGKIRLEGSGSTNPVAVGDRVSFECSCEPTPEHPASIVSVLDRRNYLIRRSTNLSRRTHVIAANIDEAFIVVSLYFPQIKLPFLDRILVMCGVYGVPVSLVLNKVDMYREEAPEEIAAFRRIYGGAGYNIIETSALTGEGIPALRERCKGKVCLFSGESGAGKSSLIHAIDPTLDPKVGEISEVHLQGKHTTSLYEMYCAQCGAWIIDTPGLRGFGLVDLEKEEISKYFPEMLAVADECRFVPCTHTHEPDCAVQAAVDDGRISAERYASYLGMLEEDRKFR